MAWTRLAIPSFTLRIKSINNSRVMCANNFANSFTNFYPTIDFMKNMTEKKSKKQVVQMQNVCKWFGEFKAIDDINLTVFEGERIVICGPSGSGKSTLIRCLNGLEKHQSGKITVHGIELDDNAASIRKIRQNVGMVFQQFNLFPHLTV